MDEQMFCFQCEQAAHCTACTGKAGVLRQKRGHSSGAGPPDRRTHLLRQPAHRRGAGPRPGTGTSADGRTVHHHHQRELRPADRGPADREHPCGLPRHRVRLRHGKPLARAGRGHPQSEIVRPVQPARHGSVQLPCAGAGPHRPGAGPLLLRSIAGRWQRMLHRHPMGTGAEDRQGQLPLHGAAGCR